MDGFVYIIESPSSDDLLDGRTEGRSLSEALTLAGIQHWYSLATDEKTSIRALAERLIQAWQYHQRPPILHFSMHGDQDGVELTSGKGLSWHDLRQLLVPLNRAMKGGLLISMSSCFGSSGCRMAMYADNEPPFWALVGNTGSPSWADAAVAYISFYHLFFKGYPLETCVETMKAASADHNFIAHSGHEMKQNWLLHLQNQLTHLGSEIQQAANQVQKAANAQMEAPPQ